MPKPLHIFDIEATGYDTRLANSWLDSNKGLGSIEEFKRVSQDSRALWNHPLFRAHDRAQIAQLYASGGLFRDHGWNTLTRNDPRFDESAFAREHGFFENATRYGTMTPEQRLGRFYQGLERQITGNGKVTLAGHNIGAYDLWLLERSTYQYDSLTQYRGWLGKMARGRDAKLVLRDTYKDFLSQTLAYAKKDREFGARALRGADTMARLHRVGGKKLEDLATALGHTFVAHDAFEDVGATGKLFGRLNRGLTPDFLKKVFPVAAETEVKAIAEAMVKGSGAGIERKLGMSGKGKAALVAAMAALVATSLALGMRRDRQTQITGLSDAGVAPDLRHRFTSFGSGWQGIDTQLETEQAYNPWLRGAGILGVGGAAWAAHRHMLRTDPRYIRRMYGWATKFEELSPFQWGRTFGLSERLGAYLPNQLIFERSKLVRNGQLIGPGITLQRQFRDRLDIIQHFRQGGSPLVFNRKDFGSAHLELAGRPDISAMFVPSRQAGSKDAGRRLASVAEVYGQDLNNDLIEWSNAKKLTERGKENWKAWHGSQKLHASYAEGAVFEGMEYLPFHTKLGARITDEALEPLQRAQAWFSNLSSRAGVEALELTQRPQVMFADLGVGVKRGTYNKALHLPFVGKGGYLNEILLKRVLPIAAGVTAVRYADYLLGHKPSNMVIDAALKANVMRADLADTLPGARHIAEFYEQVVPGPQYGPLALPLAGAFIGGLYHYRKVLKGDYVQLAKTAKEAVDLRNAGARILPKLEAIKGAKTAAGLKTLWKGLGYPGEGAAIGLAAMLPFIPGMLFPRKTGDELRDIYSGVEPVPVRAGRWWELGSSSFEGGRIKEWRAHRSILMKSRAYEDSLWGSEKEYWAHNPFIHPFRWLRDPYALEEHNYQDRPYPVTSPAFTNVPLVGPLLAATVGRAVKPSRPMHEEEWNGEQYTLYSTRLEPRGPQALPPPEPQDEYSLWNVIKKEARIMTEFTGLPGFVAYSSYNAAFPDYGSPNVYWQGSRQMNNFSQRYYEMEMGAGIGPSPTNWSEHFGYSEPFRRFVQREIPGPQANEIPNRMPSWIPGADYFVDLRRGDPYSKITEGWARLPGAGYEALHPELKGTPAEKYPDIYKLSILADVAPYSREYNVVSRRVGNVAEHDTELDIEYQKIQQRVRQTKDSIVRMDQRRFTGEVDEIEGTVAAVGMSGFTLKEYPGRRFQFSSVGSSAADMSAAVLREHNDWNKSEVANEIRERRRRMVDSLVDNMGPGTSVQLTIPKGTADSAETIRAVVQAGGTNINRQLIDEGFGEMREDLGGAESQAMYGAATRTFGSVAEGLSFAGDSSVLNPMRYIPSPAHTKFWQERTPLAQYIQQEVSGTRLRRWERPVHDFLSVYARGAAQRLTGQTIVSSDTQHRRDLNSLSDILTYMRGLSGYTNQVQRTSVGANLFASPTFVASTLPENEAHYFRQFLAETNPDQRAEILEVASPEMQRALSAQWTAQQARIAEAEGHSVGQIGEGGRLYTKTCVEEFEHAKTRLGYGDYMRSREIADFFSRTGWAMPEPESAALDENLDYQDVKLRIVQQEGYDAHDFSLFDDRTAMLWRKPYVDGAVRELTAGNSRSAEQLRLQVEQLMLASHNRNSQVMTSVHAAHNQGGNVRVDVEVDDREDMYQDMRRNPERYKEM